LQNSSESARQKCPGCGKGMERIMSASGVQMGSGSEPPPACGGGACQTGTCPYN
jgi:hypothetical protein